MNTTILADLAWRGLIHQTTGLQELEALLATPTSFFIGFDPTAESLHMGSLLQLITARRLQNAGHRPVILVGGGTGLIGDPKPQAERSLNSEETVNAWTQSIAEQVSNFIDFESENAGLVVDNFAWISELSTIDFLRNVGKHFSINKMLARDVVSSRLESGMSFTEFSYMLLQSLDFLELFKVHDVKLQFGGSDQWGNIVSGVELIRKEIGGQAHGFTSPLLLKPDGTKFGKTENGTVWLDSKMTSPFDFFQFLLNTEDALVEELLRKLTFLERSEIEALMETHNESPWQRQAQRVLAAEVTKLVHGEAEASLVESASHALFAKDTNWTELEPTVLETALRAAGAVQVDVLPATMVDALVLTSLATSKSDARRALQEKSIRMNGLVVEEDVVYSEEVLLAGKFVVLARGKKKLSGIIQT